MRKYAREPKSIANLTFEMIEQIVSPIKPGENIKIWEKRTPTKYDVKKYRLVTGKVKAVYSKIVHVQVEERGEACYNECFLKSDLARYKFEIQ